MVATTYHVGGTVAFLQLNGCRIEAQTSQNNLLLFGEVCERSSARNHRSFAEVVRTCSTIEEKQLNVALTKIANEVLPGPELH